ncbi:MAG: sulfotransferase family protein [Thermoleophilaceae bacterium]
MTVQPVFVFSVTRSGSTLVQRILGSYEEIATATEPYLLLPYLYTLRKRGVVSEYTHHFAVEAIEDFCDRLPKGVDDYRSEVRALVLRLYEKAAGEGARYFVDKTPAYFFVVDDILRLFPDGKFIFLWRNPLSVLASLIRFREGLWDPASYPENLFNGLPSLVSAYRRHEERACSVRYEDLVVGDEGPWRRLMSYLEVEFDPASLRRFSDVRLPGRGGDPFGVKQYSSLSTEPLGKWRETLNNPVRKAWCRRYLRWLGRDRLEVMGYDLDELRAQLDEAPSSTAGTGADCARLASALLKEPLRARARRSVGLHRPSGLRYLFEA